MPVFRREVFQVTDAAADMNNGLWQKTLSRS